MRYITVSILIGVILLTIGTSFSCLTKKKCSGKIEAVLLIEQDDCDDLKEMLSWLEEADINQGILVLYNIRSWSDNESLGRIKKRLAVIEYTDSNYRKPIKDSVQNFISEDINFLNQNISKKLSKESFIEKLHVPFIPPDNKSIVNATDNATLLVVGQSNILNITSIGKLNFSGLDTCKAFIEAVKKLNLKLTFNPELLEGGDVFRVENHIILGRRSLEKLDSEGNKLAAEKRMRQLYHLSKDVTVDFLTVSEQHLYHLDLFITYAGINRKCKMQFFVGCGTDTCPGGNSNRTIVKIGKALQQIKPSFDSILSKYFKQDEYDLDTLPVFVNNYYLISPLNGILDCDNKSTTYYFPYPEGFQMADAICMNKLYATADSAFAIVESKVKARKMHVPLYLQMWSENSPDGGQSLHCSMAVIKRK